MVLADDRILEYIRAEGSGSPTEMAESGYVRYSSGYISKRAGKLAERGLLDNLGNGVYTITERGERYLDGEIDTSEDAPDEVPDSNNSGPTTGNSEHV
jgi:hypothetical protein